MEKKRSAYAEKLLDPRWQKMRLQILERDKCACQICFDAQNTLHVHHRFYERGKEPWEYADSALVTLCADCHENETNLRKEEEDLLLKALRHSFFEGDIGMLSLGFTQMELVHQSEVVACALSWLLSNPEEMRRIVNKYLEQIQPRGENK